MHDFGTPESAWVRTELSPGAIAIGKVFHGDEGELDDLNQSQIRTLNIAAALAVEAERTTPVAPVSPDATGAVQAFNQIIDYVMRYGGRCRDCADEDGICPTNGTPCEPKVKRAVIEHTLKSLEYGLSHGFIENPFSIPKPDATGKCGELKTIGFVPPMFAEGKGANYNDIFRSVSIAENYTAVVTRSQAVELLAAERAEKEELDAECRVLAKRCIEKDARIKELDRCHEGTIDLCNQKTVQIEALEAKLAAAERALEPFAEHANDRAVDDTGWRDKETVKIVVSIGDLRKARAVLGGKPS
ncbi:hypothetical protein ACRS7F_13375 [Brucella anthropi]|uniref:hypothetical protein n=1 Tax=Brucella anthropi TaxID=529 RepID=UPI003EE0A4A6